MKRLRLTALAIATGLAFSAPAGAQKAAETLDIATYFANLAANPDELRFLTEGIVGPMPDTVWDTYLIHVLPILRDPAYPAYVAERIGELAGSAVTEEALLRDFAAMGDAWAFGLIRLSQADQEEFLNLQVPTFTWVRENAPEICGGLTAPTDGTNNGLIVATLSAEQAEAIRTTNALAMPFAAENPDHTEAYYALVARAALAEIHGTPEPRTVPDGAVSIDVLFAYSIAMFDRVTAMPGGEDAVAFLMATDPDAAMEGVAPEALCDLAIAGYEAINDLPASEREALVLALITSFADPAAGMLLLGGPL